MTKWLFLYLWVDDYVVYVVSYKPSIAWSVDWLIGCSGNTKENAQRLLVS